MVLIGGIMAALNGIVAIFQDEVYLVGDDNIVAFDFTVWGIIHLMLGIIAIAAAFALMDGRLWARLAVMLVAAFNIVATIGFITAYPLWSLAIIGINIAVIYACSIHGEEIEEDLPNTSITSPPQM
jgi:hypothetical protein